LKELHELQDTYNGVFFISLNSQKRSEYVNGFCKEFKLSDDQVNVEPTVTPEWLEQMPVHHNNNRYNVYSVLYHNKKAFDLISKYQEAHKMKFDGVLIYRPDIQTPDGLVKLEMPEENTYHTLHDPGLKEMHPEGWEHPYGVNGIVGYGTVDTIKKYCDAVDNLQKLDTLIYHEGILEKQLKTSGVKIKDTMIFNYKLDPRRYDRPPNE